MLELLWVYIVDTIDDTLFEWVRNLLEPLCAKGGWREKLGLTLLFMVVIIFFAVMIWSANR